MKKHKDICTNQTLALQIVMANAWWLASVFQLRSTVNVVPTQSSLAGSQFQTILHIFWIVWLICQIFAVHNWFSRGLPVERGGAPFTPFTSDVNAINWNISITCIWCSSKSKLTYAVLHLWLSRQLPNHLLLVRSREWRESFRFAGK